MSWNNFLENNNDSCSIYPEGTKIIKELDEKFRKFIEDYNVYEVKIPSLISEEVLKRCGYFETFPQHLTKLAPYQDNPSYRRKRYLTPAACIHIYPMLEKECKTHSCYTTVERVYRYENGKFDEPERLWEFTVREFVFVGNKDFVKKALSDIKEKALIFAKEIDKNAVICEAHDFFHPTPTNKMKEKIQLSNHMKDELLLELEGRKIAVASFNYHGYHFSRPFHFDQDGEIVTGCVGFGLERWLECCKICNTQKN